MARYQAKPLLQGMKIYGDCNWAGGATRLPQILNETKTIVALTLSEAETFLFTPTTLIYYHEVSLSLSLSLLTAPSENLMRGSEGGLLVNKSIQIMGSTAN